MGATIQLVSLLIGLVPTIIQAIIAVEQAVTAPKAGADKLALVVQAVLGAVETAVPDVLTKLGEAKIAGYVTKFTDLAVSTLNKLGIFKSAGA